MLDLWEIDFLRRGLITGIIIASLAPLIGTFLVVKKYSHIAHTLAHTSVLGVAIGIFFDLPIITSALITSLIIAILMEKARLNTKLSAEVWHAVVLALSISATGILSSTGFNTDVWSYLFGSISTISQSDYYLIISISLIIALLLIIFYRHFFLLAMDEELATASGLNIERYNIVMILITSLFISLSVQVIGGLLISALLVLPVVTALQFNKSFLFTMILAVFFSLLSVIVGMIAAYELYWPTGSTIVLLMGLWLLITWVFLAFKKLYH